MVITEDTALRHLNDAKAIVTDSHFVYQAGNHEAVYVNKDSVYTEPWRISVLCRGLAERFTDDAIETVIGPEKGGIILAQWIARHLADYQMGKTVRAVFAEKESVERHTITDEGYPYFTKIDGFAIKRGYDAHIIGKRVLVVEDVLTTGGSALAVVEVVRAIGGEVVGVAALCNRGNVTPDKIGNVPKLVSLVHLPFETWPADQCPLCKSGIPINTSLGKGTQFLAAQKTKI